MIRLTHVNRNFQRRARKFLAIAANSAVQSRVERDIALSHTLIEMQTAIGYVARSVYLAYAVGGRRASGAWIPRTGISTNQALLNAAKVKKKKATQVPGRDEPAWHSPSDFTLVCNTLGIATGVVSAIGYFPKSTNAVKRARHFYAHRNQDTYRHLKKALFQDYSVLISDHPSEVLPFPILSSPPLLERWINDYMIIADDLCQ